MKRNVLTLIIGAVLLVIFALLLFVFQVRKSEVAVVTTFGRPVANLTDPGAYFKWPWPVQNVYKFDQRVQNFEDKFSQTYTKDNFTILTSVYVGWKINDASAFFRQIPGASLPAAQQLLENIVRNAKNERIGKHALSEFVNTDPQEVKFEAIEQEIEAAVKNQLSTNNYGIEIEFLGFKKLGLPDAVVQTVFQRMQAERQKYVSKYQFDGEAKAAEIKSSADLSAAETVNNAVAVATRIRAEGEAEAAQTLPVFQQNPELAVFLYQLDTLKLSLNQKTTLIFDERTPPFDLFRNLPANPSGK
jgi:membrane protease subunit HflC